MQIFQKLYYIVKNFFLFKSYFKELWYKFIYGFLSFLILFFINYFYMDVLIYLLAKNLFLNIDSSKFFFSNVSQLFWLYLKISLAVSFIISIPFFAFNSILFFFEGFNKRQRLFFWSYIFLFFFFYFFFLFGLYNFIMPHILKFFLSFNIQNELLTIHFEAKIEEYFNFILDITFFLGFFFFWIILFIFLNFCGVLKDHYLFLYKRHIYIFFFLFSILISPPDIILQIFYILFIILFFECFFFFKLLFKNFY